MNSSTFKVKTAWTLKNRLRQECSGDTVKDGCISDVKEQK